MGENLPVFPLNSVLLPGGILPLRIFEPRYVDMVSHCLRNDSGFVVAIIKKGQETGAAAEFYSIGTLAKIVDWERCSDGLLGITAQGCNKARILNWKVEKNQLIHGDIESFSNEPQNDLPLEFDKLSLMLKRILKELGSPYSTQAKDFTDAGWVAGRLVELLPLELAQKQALLELEDPLSRLFQLRDNLLNLELL